MTTNTPASPGKEPVAAEPWACAGCGTASLKTERACECPTNVLCRDGFQCWKDSDDPCSQLRDAAKLALETLAPWKDDDFVWATMTQLNAAISNVENPTEPPVNGCLRAKITDALASELSDSVDCTRVWEAWTVGTMGEDDFVPVTERIAEIADAVLGAILSEMREIIAAEITIGARYATADRIIAAISKTEQRP